MSKKELLLHSVMSEVPQKSDQPSPPESPHGGSCRICMDAPPDEELLSNVCGCKTAKVHHRCLQSWVSRTSKPTCEICQQPYNVALVLPTTTQRGSRRHNTPRAKYGYASVPMLIGFLYGHTYLSLAKSQILGLEIAFFENLALLSAWGLFVAFPGCRHVLDRKSAKIDVAVLCLSYLCFLTAWLVQRFILAETVPSSRVDALTLPAHFVNGGLLTGCILVRTVCAAYSSPALGEDIVNSPALELRDETGPEIV